MGRGTDNVFFWKIQLFKNDLLLFLNERWNWNYWVWLKLNYSSSWVVTSPLHSDCRYIPDGADIHSKVTSYSRILSANSQWQMRRSAKMVNFFYSSSGVGHYSHSHNSSIITMIIWSDHMISQTLHQKPQKETEAVGQTGLKAETQPHLWQLSCSTTDTDPSGAAGTILFADKSTNLHSALISYRHIPETECWKMPFSCGFYVSPFVLLSFSPVSVYRYHDPIFPHWPAARPTDPQYSFSIFRIANIFARAVWCICLLLSSFTLPLCPISTVPPLH